MENVVPSPLQRLRAADIIRMVGLSVASLGQEYYRIGAVHQPKRQSARLMGSVEVPSTAFTEAASAANRVDAPLHDGKEATPHNRPLHCTVEIEIHSASVWRASCSCQSSSSPLCPHVAALLYHWLAHPVAFEPSSVTSPTPPPSERAERMLSEQKKTISTKARTALLPSLAQAGAGVRAYGLASSDTIEEILAQLGLSELRNLAREHGITSTGMSKQQLADALLTSFKQPETIRTIASTLEKPQRQLLATMTLAGGLMPDEDLRGLFERFSLGYPHQFQSIVLALQNKGLLFRTNLSGSALQRTGLSGTWIDIGWCVPLEVRVALRVTLPTTAFDIQKSHEKENEAPQILQAETYRLLADLLLVARTLDGYRLEHEEQASSPSVARPPSTLSIDGSVAIQPPAGLPDPALLATLQTAVPRSPAFLRFAFRLLRLADILHRDDAGTPYLRILPDVARLLLSPTQTEIARDLFELWRTQPTYDELFDLQEEGLHLRCRATPLNHPVLRPGELAMENSEARQTLIALLVQAPLNQWISFTAFTRFVYRLHPLFLQKRQRMFPSPHWWVEQEIGHPLNPLQPNDWLHAEGRYLTRLVQGPLHWWGITDLAMASDGRLLAFRLTPMADFLFNGNMPNETFATPRSDSANPKDPTQPLLKIGETGELLVACTSAAWPLITLLENFVEGIGVQDGHLRYRLSPRVLSTALARGQRPTALIPLLHEVAARSTDARSANSLLNTISQLEQWTANYGRVRVYTDAALLEGADSLVMRELTATTSIEQHIVQPLSPTLLILKKQGAERLIDELKRRGQVPLLHEEEHYGAE